MSRALPAWRAFCLLLAFGFAAAAGPVRSADRSADAPAHSVATVDDLLRLENDKAREAVRRSREQAGLGAAPAGPGAVPASRLPMAPPLMTVESISRLGDGPVRIALSVDGRRIDAATVGTRAGACEIVRVAGACVHFAAVPVRRRADRAATPCPTACWTGLAPPLARTDGPWAAGPAAASAGLAAAPPLPATLLPPRAAGDAGPAAGGGPFAPALR